jgi:hypothetical protein
MLGKTKPLHGRRNMKAISMMVVAAAIAFPAVFFTATPGAAKTESVKPQEQDYCLSYEAGTDCFTSYQQCEATASGIGGDCRSQDTGGGAQGHPAHR